MKRAGKSFSCLWLLIHWLLNKTTVALGENSWKRNYFIDGKHGMENFNTTDLRRFSWLGKPHMHKKIIVKSHSKNNTWYIQQQLTDPLNPNKFKIWELK